MGVSPRTVGVSPCIAGCSMQGGLVRGQTADRSGGRHGVACRAGVVSRRCRDQPFCRTTLRPTVHRVKARHCCAIDRGMHSELSRRSASTQDARAPSFPSARSTGWSAPIMSMEKIDRMVVLMISIGTIDRVVGPHHVHRQFQAWPATIGPFIQTAKCERKTETGVAFNQPCDLSVGETGLHGRGCRKLLHRLPCRHTCHAAVYRHTVAPGSSVLTSPTTSASLPLCGTNLCITHTRLVAFSFPRTPSSQRQTRVYPPLSPQTGRDLLLSKCTESKRGLETLDKTQTSKPLCACITSTPLLESVHARRVTSASLLV